uniref:Putative ribonuclease H-like domain-containing protein n=1 Tax=Tanacetum cinerariifolium TaxID=118510 RepID=A0A699L6X6_TANCI|nr:putative ribonuclease H-like domain-containing protein [Tanacetum cinerariifolium]
MYKLHTKPTQTRTSQLPNDFKKTNKRVSFSTRVIPTTSVSRPQLKSNLIEDRVMLNNSQGKKQEVEDHRRNVKYSKNKTPVTVCNDSLKAKTSNVNFVCATYGKCVLNEKHDMCVLKSRNGVNSRTKMPMASPLVEIILFIVDSECSKHMTGNLKLLINFMEKFLISELKKLIEKLKGKSIDTKYEKSLVIRQLNAFKSQRPSILESDGEMCKFALTVSQTEPKNIKKAMADSAWIESMQEELHQFDRLDV